MKKCLIILIALMAISLFARPVVFEESKKIADYYIGEFNNYYESQNLESGFLHLNHEILRNDDEIIGFVFNLYPKGFIVISADTRTEALIYYSFKKNLNTVNSDENFPMRFLRDELCNRARYLKEAQETTDRMIKNHQQWLGILSGHATILSPMTEYGPLLDTQWDQDSPYNDYCPVDAAVGAPCVTGCVATALAQVINYYEYPTFVAFDESDNYYCETISPASWITASMATIDDIVYDGAGDHPTDEIIARLCFAAGVSVKMAYGPVESGARLLPEYIIDKWRFGTANQFEFSHEAFLDELRLSIINEKPCPMSIRGGIGGHAIVADGYNDATGAFHLNFGWSGSSDGWYVLPDGLPMSYTEVEDAIMHISPPDTSTYMVPGDFASIGEAVSSVLNGATVTVGDGVWDGPDNTNIDFEGKFIYLRSLNGPLHCTIDCGGNRAFIEPYSIEGFKIINGNADEGGAIYDSRNLMIKNCIFEDNSSDEFGGAIYVGVGKNRLENCIFNDNVSDKGGATYTYKNCDIVNCTFTNNNGALGGGVFVKTDASNAIMNCIFRDNTAGFGRDIFLMNGNLYDPGAILFIAYCDINEANIQTLDPSAITLTIGEGMIDDDPLFTDYYKPSTESPVIDMGINIVQVEFEEPYMLAASHIDIERNDRPLDDGYDMGAYEVSLTGIREKQEKPDMPAIAVYPNPFNSAMSIDVEGEPRISFYSLNGKLIKKLPIGVKTWQPNADINSGIYLMQVEYEDHRSVTKVLYSK